MKTRKFIAAVIITALSVGMLSACKSEQESGKPAAETSIVSKKIETTADTPDTTVNISEQPTETVTESGMSLSELHGHNPVRTELSAFDIYMLRQVAEENRDNLMLSPLSAKLAVNMATLGADDGSDTEKQLLTAFGYKDKDELRSAYVNLYDILFSPLPDSDEKTGPEGEFEIEIFPAAGGIEFYNSMWIDNTDAPIVINQAYRNDVENTFNADIFETDLQNENIVPELNGWVSDKTHKLIPSLINSPFEPECSAVLINTLYFKGKWQSEFDKELTDKQTFYSVPWGPQETDFMHKTSHGILYKESDTYQSVALDYTDSTSMKIFIPKAEDGNIADVIAGMSDEDIKNALNSKYENAYVSVNMPKFETESNMSLKEYLQSVGVTNAFSPLTAEFTLMKDIAQSSDNVLYIGDVIQSTKIICDEDGTEAAAATMVIMKNDALAMPEIEEPIIFTADKPFLYVIQDSITEEILFVGIINNF